MCWILSESVLVQERSCEFVEGIGWLARLKFGMALQQWYLYRNWIVGLDFMVQMELIGSVLV
jgi:hypothetical protein